MPKMGVYLGGVVGGKRVAVVGSGIAGLSAAWLLSKQHSVTLIEAEPRAGGHSHTVDAVIGGRAVPVDTGFIVYNIASYPNLIALFDHLGVETAPTDMSFAVSLERGGYEYSGTSIATLFGQWSNIARPSHWRMLSDLMRFFREARNIDLAAADHGQTLGNFLTTSGYSEAFIARHILPMAAAIWSTPSHQVLDFPLAAFVRFFDNHGLLQVRDRPQWRTVVGGSREYVRKLLADFGGDVVLGDPATRIVRSAAGVNVCTRRTERRFDACVLATHADNALSLLDAPTEQETALLGAFRYTVNRAILHTDTSLMPRRRRLWSSWNYLSTAGTDPSLAVTYWMNRLQPLGRDVNDVFVTLNPPRPADPHHVKGAFDYAHPVFDTAAMNAQRQLWSLQGLQNTWFCGSYFGYGFHEDGLQSGLAAAEAFGGVRRPWHVPDESGRIHLRPTEDADRPDQLEAAE